MTEILATLPNFRDLGGHATTRGRRVRAGRLYRSVDLSRLDETDRARLAALGIARVFDLRSPAEQSASPDRLPEGAVHRPLDVLADAHHDAPAQLQDILKDPALADRVLGDGRAVERFHQAYRDIVGLPSALSGYRRLFAELAVPGGTPALVHCATGKDRTGWAAAALLEFLGVPPDRVTEEYLRTNDDLLPALKPLFDRFAEAGGDPALLIPVLGVRQEYLDVARAEVQRRFGGIDGYFTHGLGLSPAEQERLRTAFLE